MGTPSRLSPSFRRRSRRPLARARRAVGVLGTPLLLGAYRMPLPLIDAPLCVPHPTLRPPLPLLLTLPPLPPPSTLPPLPLPLCRVPPSP